MPDGAGPQRPLLIVSLTLCKTRALVSLRLGAGWLRGTACGISAPQPGTEHRPRQWACCLLTPGLPGNSWWVYIFKGSLLH